MIDFASRRCDVCGKGKDKRKGGVFAVRDGLRHKACKPVEERAEPAHVGAHGDEAGA